MRQLQCSALTWASDAPASCQQIPLALPLPLPLALCCFSQQQEQVLRALCSGSALQLALSRPWERTHAQRRPQCTVWETAGRALPQPWPLRRGAKLHLTTPTAMGTGTVAARTGAAAGAGATCVTSCARGASLAHGGRCAGAGAATATALTPLPPHLPLAPPETLDLSLPGRWHAPISCLSQGFTGHLSSIVVHDMRA